MAGKIAAPQRKSRLRTELSAADEAHLQAAVELFGLPKAELIRRLIRSAVQAGPALSADNEKIVAALAMEVRIVGRNLSQVLKAIRCGEVVGLEDTEPVWNGLHAVTEAISDELSVMVIGQGAKLRVTAGLAPADAMAAP